MTLDRMGELNLRVNERIATNRNNIKSDRANVMKSFKSENYPGWCLYPSNVVIVCWLDNVTISSNIVEEFYVFKKNF
ncbi:CLUMA_CG007818, isoform A [Clunio marinus]|uniref:CLUMA_CG007818, isoform A n=1 Tax=Clunio marinus TaxID=568069 RepID=A0A1J1I1T5_9DIPT|nr:CLUMA_CG007818, isoform A [Clunio marinus]